MEVTKEWMERALIKNALSKKDKDIIRHMFAENERLVALIGADLLADNKRLRELVEESRVHAARLRIHLDSYLAALNTDKTTVKAQG